MSLDELIGARLTVGFHGTEATPDLIQRLTALHVRTIIVFERNFLTPEQFLALVHGLEEGVGRRLLVMVDHEGGRVVRFRHGVTQFPSALTVGTTQSSDAAERQGTTEAEELKRLGVYLNLAPCIDVLVEGSDPVIGDRAYGRDPAAVTAHGLARIRGLQSHGVAACAKHFPGLGAVQRDPHKTLLTIVLDWNAMRTIHLPPFQAAIQAGVATVMSSHVCYPGLGEPSGLPATFSPRLITELLRNELQFPGLIFTDDLEMGALQTFGTMGEVAIRATEAGHDLLLICSDLAKAEEAFAALREAYRTGRLPEDKLQGSVRRLNSLQAKLLGTI